MKRAFLTYLWWAVCATLWATLCFLLPDFCDNPLHGLRAVMTVAAYLLALGAASFWVLYLLGLNKYVAAVTLPLFGIGGAVVSYYRVAFYATITPMIIDATLHTNGGTVAGVVSWQLFAWVALNILIAVAFVWWRWRIQQAPKAWLQALVVLALLLLYYHANGRLHMSINQRYPYNVVHSSAEYAKQQQQLRAERETMPYAVEALPDSIDIVFVLGEAMRADHLQLNGYPRATTPRLAARTNIVSTPYIYSPHAYTSTSVPFILSPADSIHPDRSATHHSFIRTFHECGFRSAWLSNQDQGRTYVSFIHEADTLIFPNANKSVFVFDPWYDGQLLPPLDSLMANASPRNIYILHTIGSHWYYNLHVPEPYQLFQPVTANRVITNNTPQQIINSYDNTAVYMDAVIDSLIQRLEHRCALLIYLSDHGEALGEDGHYLHAGDSEPLHQPACFIWYSDKYAATYPDKIKALVANKDKRYRTDFLYYSILSAAGIEAEGGNEEMNIFR